MNDQHNTGFMQRLKNLKEKIQKEKHLRKNRAELRKERFRDGNGWGGMVSNIKLSVKKYLKDGRLIESKPIRQFGTFKKLRYSSK